MKKRDFETYQKRFRDFEILPKFSETHVFGGTIRHPQMSKKLLRHWTCILSLILDLFSCIDNNTYIRVMCNPQHGDMFFCLNHPIHLALSYGYVLTHLNYSLYMFVCRSLVGAGLSQFKSDTLKFQLPFFERFRNTEDR